MVKGDPAATLLEPATGYKHVDYHGVVYPPFVDAATVDMLRQNAPSGFRPAPQDVCVVTYPKCGTTWMQQIVLTLLAGGNAAACEDPMKQSPWIERVASSSAEKRAEILAHGAGGGGERHVWKTHAPAQLAPWDAGMGAVPSNGARCIVVSRSPLDVCVSLFHHTRDSTAFGCPDVDLEAFTELFLGGKVESGDYWAWHRGWWEASQGVESAGKVLWVFYEDLIEDMEAQVRRIANFAGIDASNAVVAQVVQASEFKSMKRTFERVNSEKLARGESIKKNHIRAGKVGGWRGGEYGAVQRRRGEFTSRSAAMPEGFWSNTPARAEALGQEEE